MLAKRLRIFALLAGAATSALCQVSLELSPIPSDPLELVTGAPKVVETAEERAAAVSMLNHARDVMNLHSGAAFTLRMSFLANGPALATGPGQMEETWSPGGNGRWTASLGDFSLARVFQNSSYFDEKPLAAIPMRLQMIRGAIFWPIQHPVPSGSFATDFIRAFAASWKGVQVSCLLFSGGAERGRPMTPGRRWGEVEFCIDPQSGLLRTYSYAPGNYVVYDYDNEISFHGKIIPRQILISENGQTAAQAQLDVQDPAPGAIASFPKPSREMIANGAALILDPPLSLGGTNRTTPVQAGSTIPVVVIHFILDPSGKVLDAEPLQTSDPALAQEALDQVRSGTIPFPKKPNTQKEIFMAIEFFGK
jgi:hypothetical protein